MLAIILAVSIYWHLPVLIVLVSIVYSATRYDDWSRIWHHAVRNGVYVLVFMGAVFLMLFFLSSVVRWLW
jgi:hypothetical protein